MLRRKTWLKINDRRPIGCIVVPPHASNKLWSQIPFQYLLDMAASDSPGSPGDDGEHDDKPRVFVDGPGGADTKQGARLLVSSVDLPRSNVQHPRMVRCRANAASNISESVSSKSTNVVASQTSASRFLPICVQWAAMAAMDQRMTHPIVQLPRMEDPMHIKDMDFTSSRPHAMVAAHPKRVSTSTSQVCIWRWRC